MNGGKKLLKEAKWIWPQTNFYDLYNTYAQFRKDFELKEIPEKAEFYITADQGYRLWINGKYITRGPARGYQSHWPYDEVEVAAYLKPGNNYISVEVYNPGVSTFGYISQTRAGLLCAGDFGEVKIRSNNSWISRIDSAHKKDTAKYSLQINFQEHVDGREDDRSWIASADMPTGWVSPEETPFGSMPWYDLEERGIPQLKEKIRVPVDLVSRTTGVVDKSYPSWRNIVAGLHGEFETVKWERLESLLEKGASVKFSPADEGAFQAVVLDMGETVVGPATLQINGGTPGIVLDLFYHELLNTDASPVMRHPDSIHCRTSMGNRIILSGDSTFYTFYQILGFRYITVVLRENTTPVSLKLEVTDTGYPYTLTGSFQCSDETLNHIWKICRRTEEVCSLDAYVDTPWREQAQWWGDARVQFWNTMAIDGDVKLFKRGIRSIAGQKVPNGLTYGHAPTMAHNCILPDFSLVWILSIYDYYMQTKDLSLFEEQLPRINEVLAYFEKEAPKYEGLLGYDERYWLFLDWSNLEKSGVPTLYNMWYLMALRTVAQMYKLAGRMEEAASMERKSAELQETIEDILLDGEMELFCDGINEAGIQHKKYSVHSQTLAIMLDLKPEYQKQMLEERILPFLRGEKLEEAVPSTYWTSYVMTAAREKGYYKEVLAYITRMWTPMIPFSTCSELFAGEPGDSSYSHAWSAHPVFHLMNLLGGVVQDTAGWDTIVFEPYFSEKLDWVQVRHPSPYGLIESRWQREKDGIKVTLELPEGITAKVKVPGYDGKVTKHFEYIVTDVMK